MQSEASVWQESHVLPKTKKKEVLPHRQLKQMINITNGMINEHIERNIRRWLFASYIGDRHVNQTWSGLRERLGKYGMDCRRVTYTATFLDNSCGEDIANEISEGLKAHAAEILHWLQSGAGTTLLALYIRSFPENVAGITCSAYDRGNIEDADGYIAIISKYGQPLFRLVNVLPVRTTTART